MRIGLITDTHLPALFRQLDGLGPECGAFLTGVDLILHGGDVTAPSVLDWLAQFAPVVAAQGNNDDFHDPRLRKVQYLELEGWRIGMAHNLAPETQPLHAVHYRCFDRPLDIMIGGHTHLERLRHEHGMLLVNSGSPILPHQKETRLGTAALLEITPDRVRAEIVVLGETPGRPNPGQSALIELERDSFHAAHQP
ncbi:MAG TPA: metallophosphoesterase family protein [Dehalococcoidia bacterium]|nr:metallophosphoesterase family protein [Dehalococcoidia bacterium]